jgi:hypothetical protein
MRFSDAPGLGLAGAAPSSRARSSEALLKGSATAVVLMAERSEVGPFEAQVRVVPDAVDVIDVGGWAPAADHHAAWVGVEVSPA